MYNTKPSSIKDAETTHLQRTSTNTRQNVLTRATVDKIEDISPTVKHLTMKVHEGNFTFKAGQWVDFVIPAVNVVGGYSMCSSPHQLLQNSTLELAVKYSTHPPALWVHTQCKEGTKVSMRVGGDFHYNPTASYQSHDLLLIAGGVGINPLYSILQHASHLHTISDSKLDKLHILYSAATHDELIFKDSIADMCQNTPTFSCKFFVTKEKPTSQNIQEGRINLGTVSASFGTGQLDSSKTRCYICGPSSMIDSLEEILIKLGITKDRIFYEKWY